MKKIVIDYINLVKTDKPYSLDNLKLDKISSVIKQSRNLSADDMIEVSECVNGNVFKKDVISKRDYILKILNR